MADSSTFRVVEFYSGIGGMHYALKGCKKNAEVVAALEISTTANTVYGHNFPTTKIWNCNIEGLTAEALDKLQPDVFLMSPPCQPYTRVGLQGASKDPRALSFLHILSLLKRLQHPPKYWLIENVKGFETSDTREHLVQTLKENHYSFQEFLLTPVQFGIPNSRLRYYLLAKRHPLTFSTAMGNKIMESIPNKHRTPDKRKRPGSPIAETKEQYEDSDKSSTGHEGQICVETDPDITMETSGICHAISSKSNLNNCCCHVDKNRLDASGEDQTKAGCVCSCDTDSESPQCGCRCAYATSCKEAKLLQYYLEKEKKFSYYEQFLLPTKVLSRFSLVLDIVTAKSRRSCCFTKAYGHYAEGTGSVLKMSDCEDTTIFSNYSQSPEATDEEKAKILAPLGLRYFTPREVANLMCFPKSFEFPASTSNKQKYRLLGNSLNVAVVTELLKYLLTT